jgi:hypothetical protein
MLCAFRKIGKKLHSCTRCGRTINASEETETIYRKCRAGRDGSPTEPRTTFEHCVHAQNSIRREECKKCGRKKTVDVFGCDIHGECTILNYGLKDQSGKLISRCFICPDYKEN